MIIYSAKKLFRRLKGQLKAIKIYKGSKLVWEEPKPKLYITGPSEVPATGGEVVFTIFADNKTDKPIIYNITIT